MYADAGMMAFDFTFSAGFPADCLSSSCAAVGSAQSFGEFAQLPLADDDKLFPDFASCGLPDVGSHLGNMMHTSIVSDYDLGGEGDLFKAPEPIIEEPLFGLDSMATAISMISNAEDVIAETIKVADIGSIQSDPLLSDVFYECEKDLLDKTAIEESINELLDVKIPPVHVEASTVECSENQTSVTEGLLQKSVSSECLNSMEWIHECHVRPSFLSFQGLDFEAAFGLRRAYSEGDIQNLGNSNIRVGSTANVQTSFERLLTVTDWKSEDRKEKLSRYRKKKIKRNFGRKIKYACRKALADSQPRVRGRFAKIEECDEKTE